MKKLFVIILAAAFISCYSAPTPIIIRQIPQADVSADMTVDEYMQSSTQWAVEITAYIKELINQIKHKVPYIDLLKTVERWNERAVLNQQTKTEDIKQN